MEQHIINNEVLKRVSAVLAEYGMTEGNHYGGFARALFSALKTPNENKEEAKGITLTIPQELYLKASSLAYEMFTQDPRATREPRYVTIREIDRVIGIDSKFDTDGYILSDPDDRERECEPDDIPEDYEEDIENFEEVYYREIEKFSGAFLSVKTAEAHLRRNGYHYNGTATTYIDHAWRNPDMELIWELMNLFFTLSQEKKEEVQP